MAVPLFSFFVCRLTVTDGLFSLPFSGTLAPLLEAYQTTCSATSQVGLTGDCVYSPKPPASRDNGPYRCCNAVVQVGEGPPQEWASLPSCLALLTRGAGLGPGF